MPLRYTVEYEPVILPLPRLLRETTKPRADEGIVELRLYSRTDMRVFYRDGPNHSTIQFYNRRLYPYGLRERRQR